MTPPPKSRRARLKDLLQQSPAQFDGSVQVVTRKGLPLRVDRWRNIPDGINEGWVVDILEAHGPGGPAGYLKLAFIPRENLGRFYPSPVEWHLRRGGGNFPEELLAKPAQEWAREETLLALSRTDEWHESTRETSERRAVTSDGDLREEWLERRRRIRLKHAKAYKEFRDFHVDRPVVDFSRVYADGEYSIYNGGVREKVDPDDVTDYRRQGVASAMYEAAAFWLAERGLELHGSGLQSDDAGALWKSFEQRGVIRQIPGPTKPRLVLDPELLAANGPTLLVS
jgi:GNAT superfamily N-acetyltransferase